MTAWCQCLCVDQNHLWPNPTTSLSFEIRFNIDTRYLKKTIFERRSIFQAIIFSIYVQFGGVTAKYCNLFISSFSGSLSVWTLSGVSNSGGATPSLVLLLCWWNFYIHHDTLSLVIWTISLLGVNWDKQLTSLTSSNFRSTYEEHILIDESLP